MIVQRFHVACESAEGCAETGPEAETRVGAWKAAAAEGWARNAFAQHLCPGHEAKRIAARKPIGRPPKTPPR